MGTGHTETNTEFTRLLAPVPGLMLERIGICANVHSVQDGKVFWGRYYRDEDLPLSLHQTSLKDWLKLEKKALKDGASVYCWIGDPPGSTMDKMRPA